MSNTKQFTVVDTRTMQIKKFSSVATTVAELKAELKNLGIYTNGMTIQEGLTKTEFKNDNALLPHDVPYKGTTTNDLVFRLTKSEKKIESGTMSRAEAYAKVKELGLAEKIATTYKKNYTVCKTSELIKEIEKANNKPSSKVDNTKECKNVSKKVCNASSNALEKAFIALTTLLVNNNVINQTDGNDIVSPLNTTIEKTEGYTIEEINDIFDEMD